jgi:chromosome segregation ATPase
MNNDELELLKLKAQRKRIDAGIDEQIIAIEEKQSEIKRLQESIEISKKTLIELDQKIAELQRKVGHQ